MTDAELRGIENIVEMQLEANRQMLARMEARHVHGIRPLPLTRSQRIKRRASYDWWRLRQRVALWIAPELGEDW